MTRTGTRWLVAGFLALLAAWALAPATVAVYDGIGSIDEPYRFVSPPPDAKTTKKPTVAKQTVSIRNGANAAQFANSAENAPQVSIYVPPASLKVPAGVSTISLQATPNAPTDPLPTDGSIVSNVYDVEAIADGKPLEVIGTGKNSPTLQMRAPTAQQPGPVFEHRTATGWVQTKTLRVGNDTYQTTAPDFGDWALVRLTHPTGSSGGGVNVALLAGGIGVLVVAGLILLIRIRRTAAGGH
jgi:hypothetical protein